MPFGEDKGKPLTEISDRSLEFYLSITRSSRLLKALEEERQRREDLDQARADREFRESQALLAKLRAARGVA